MRTLDGWLKPASEFGDNIRSGRELTDTGEADNCKVAACNGRQACLACLYNDSDEQHDDKCKACH